MKTISMTCIISGALIFIAPMLYQFGCFSLVAYALANTRLPSMNISAPSLDEGYRNMSMVLGLLLTVVGIGFAIFSGRTAGPNTTRKDSAPSLAQPDNA